VAVSLLVDLQRRVLDCAHSGQIASLAAGVSQAGTRSVATAGQLRPSGDSPFRIASLTKSLTAAAVVLALRQREIPLSTPAVELLPSLSRDWQASRDLTVEQLLGQVSGLRQSVEAPAMAALGDGPAALLAGARLVVQAGSEHEPGERWAYYNGNYFVAGAILATVTSVSYEEALAAILLRPWSLTRTGFDTPAAPVPGWDGDRPVTATPYPRARRPSGGLWSCLHDLLGFAEQIMADRCLRDELSRPRTRSGDPMAYGLGWALGPSGQLYLNGRLPGYRTAMIMLPAYDYCSVALASQQDALPAIGQLLSELQRPLSGDDLSSAVDDFAA
jgi:D-alanyl-D-alanine carboxypeptidase